MKTLLAILALALVSFVSIPSVSSAAPVKIGERYVFLESNYTETVDNYVLLGYWWEWWGYPVFVTSWQATKHDHAWGVRQLVEDWYDDETYEYWSVYFDPENYDFTDEYFIYWLEYDPPPGGGGEQAIAPPAPEEG